jgi:hypothetical protein
MGRKAARPMEVEVKGVPLWGIFASCRIHQKAAEMKETLLHPPTRLPATGSPAPARRPTGCQAHTTGEASYR